MLILRVDLENIKSYERATVEFAPGVNAIMGHNGAGKSTILEAIGYALFDALPYDADEFLREGTRTGRVAVTFVGKEDERPYRVERRVGGSHQYFAYDVELGAKLCEGKPDVLAFVRRQVGADASVNLKDIFNNAIGVPQGALTAAFTFTPGARKGVFDPLLQVDDYKGASDKLLEPRNVLQEHVRTVAQQVAVLSARLERLPELERAVRQRTEELRQIEQSLTALCARLEQIEAAKAEWDAIRRQIEQCELQHTRQVQRCAALEAQAGEARRQLAEAEGAAREVAANQEGHDQYVAAQARKEELDRQLHTRQTLRDQHARADKQLALAQSELTAIEERLAAVAAAEELIRRLAPAVQQQEQLEAALADLQKERGGLQEVAKSRAARQSELQALRTRAERLEAQLAEAEGVQQAVQQSEQAMADLRQQIAQWMGEQGAVQAAANELKRQNEALESVATALCPVCEQPLSAGHRSEMLARNGTRLQELRSTFGTNQKQIKQAEATLHAAEAEHKQRHALLRNLPRAEELEDVRGRIDQLAAAVEAGAAAEKVLAGIEGRFAALNRELSALQNPRQQSAVALQQAGERPQLLARQTAAAGQRQTASEQLAALDTSLKPLAALDDMLAEVTGTLRRSQTAYQAVLSNRKLAESTPQRAEAAAQLAAALDEGQAALAESERALQAVKAQFDPVAYASISSEDQSLRGELGGQQARQTLLRAEQERDQAEVGVLQSQQAELAGLTVEQGKLNRQAVVLEAVRTLLRQSGPYVTQALIRQVSAGATRIFGELMQDFSRELQWQEDYGIVLKVEGATRQFAQLSGGEQMSAALAVRLALVREISNIDIAFFDEPTANLDDVRREALAQQIMNVKGFRQLFVISHDDTFEQVTQNLVRVKRHGSSSIVAPSES